MHSDYISDRDYARIAREDEERKKNRQPIPDVRKAEAEFEPLSQADLDEAEMAFREGGMTRTYACTECLKKAWLGIDGGAVVETSTNPGLSGWLVTLNSRNRMVEQIGPRCLDILIKNKKSPFGRHDI